MNMTAFYIGGGVKSSHSKGFTLAEVLITLGIIGVVAAMTLPTLIQNYQKGVALNRLKQTYSQIQNAVELVASENDGNPMNQWGCPQMDYTDPDTGITYWMPWTQACFYMAMKKIAVKMYPRPDDVSHAFCYEGREYRPYTDINGDRNVRWQTNGNLLHTRAYSAKLPNGACVVWHPAIGSHDAGGSLIIDVDGSDAGFNSSGKDVFFFSYVTNGGAAPYGTHGRSIIPGRMGDGAKTRAQLKEKCSKLQEGACGTECATLIINDSWQMKSDYPW